MTEQRLSGNEVSLRDYVDGQFKAVDKQFETVYAVLEEREKAFRAAFAAAEKAVSAAGLAAEKAVDAALTSAEKAADKLEISTSRHFDSVNEFRRTFADLATTNPTRAELSAQIQDVRSEAKGLTDAAQAEARSLAKQYLAKIETLNERLSELQLTAANVMTKDGFAGYVATLETYRLGNKRATVLAAVSMLGVIATIVGIILVWVARP